MKNKKYYTTRYTIIVIGFVTVAVFLLANLFYTVGFSKLSKLRNIINNNISGEVKGESTAAPNPEIVSDYLLIIPKIRIKVPIVMEVDGEHEYNYAKALKHGVAQMAGTVKPEEVGNMVIFGHSSLDIGATGKYGEVFSNLNNLNIGDEIIILNNLDQKEIVYQVREKTIIMPEETSVINPTEQTQLTLLTCWPIGSDQKRLVVFADLKE